MSLLPHATHNKLPSEACKFDIPPPVQDSDGACCPGIAGQQGTSHSAGLASCCWAFCLCQSPCHDPLTDPDSCATPVWPSESQELVQAWAYVTLSGSKSVSPGDSVGNSGRGMPTPLGLSDGE